LTYEKCSTEQFVVKEVAFDELAYVLAAFFLGAIHGMGADA
jgi:hypothetical protein